MRPLSRLLAATLLFAVASAAGYAISTGWGREVLRRECESQLSKLLAGDVHIEQVRLRLTRGLWVEGGPVVVDYPGTGPGSDAAMRARRAVARINAFALVTGRFRLSSVRIDGFELEIGRSRSGEWQPHFVATVLRGLEGQDEDGAASGDGATAIDWEAPLALAHASEGIARTLLRKPIVGERLDVFGAVVRLHDERPMAAGAKRVDLEFATTEASLDHSSRDSRAVLILDGTLSDERGPRGRFEIDGVREGADYRSSVAPIALDLSTFRPYAAFLNPTSALAGSLAGDYRIESSEAEHKTIEIDWRVSQLVGALPLGERWLRMDTPSAKLQARFELHPRRVRLARAQLRGSEISISLRGVAERPLRSTTQARFSVDLIDAGLPLLRRAIAALPAAEARDLANALAPLRSGEISRFGLEGTAALEQWRRLLAGELLELPPGFGVTARVADVAFEASERDQLTEFEGSLLWRGDRLTLAGVRGRWNGRPLPELTLSAEGVSQLLSAPDAARSLYASASPLPGLGTLWQLLTSGPDPDTPTRARILLELDHFHHPTLYGPIEDARVEIDPQPDGLEVQLVEGRWSGIPIRGEAVYRESPAPEVEVWLRAQPADEPRATSEQPASDEPDRDKILWASGRIHATELGGPFRIASLSGRLSIRDTQLRLEHAEAKLAPKGILRGSLIAELALRDEVAIDLGVGLSGGDVAALSPGVGLPPDLATGSLDLEAQLVGTLSRDVPIHLALAGTLEVAAKDGVVYQSFPLLNAIANASEGFNPFASSDSIRYEELDVKLALDHGRLSTERFALDGPLRVFATGEIDLGQEPEAIDAVVGLFLLRQADLLLGDLPLLKWAVPGRDRGLLGAYFEVKGPLAEPGVRALTAKSIAEPIADVLTAPFRALGTVRAFLLGNSKATAKSDPGSAGGSGRQPPPAEAAR